MSNGVAIMEQSLAVPQNVKHVTAFPVLGIDPKELKTGVHSNENLERNVPSSTIHNS